MINQITIQNFKSILSLTIQPKQLNILTGLNGSGKSSLLQALLLLRQSQLTLQAKPPFVFLGNADTLVNLGTFKDIFPDSASKKEALVIKLKQNKQNLSFKSLNYADHADNESPRIYGKITGLKTFHTEPIFNNTDFQYLTADRVAPNDYFPRFEYDELLGKDGRYFAPYLSKYGNNSIPITSLCHPNEPANSLRVQVNAWLQEISPNIDVYAEEDFRINKVKLSYQYRTATGVPTPDRKPQNVGYGITPILPIIIALLSAKSNNLLLIENPETHIHPRGQSRLAMLMCRAAQAGVQIFVETHSDHIINGARVGIKSGLLAPDKTDIYFFSKSQDEVSTVETLKVHANGRLSNWPKGFFDEWDNMLDQLLY